MKPWITLAILHQLCVSLAAPYDNFTYREEPSIYRNEPSFGIEFTLDHVISSVTLGNKSTYGLARVHGGEAYQSIMRRYLETFHGFYLTQESPLEGLKQHLPQRYEDERNRRRRLIRHVENSWWDYLAVFAFGRPEYLPAVFDSDVYAGDVEVEILASAVGRVKNATIGELNKRFSIADPFPWAYGRIVAPDFFWTTTRPKPDPEVQPDGIVTWNANFDQESAWYQYILRKFSLALYRNRFRTTESSDWREILSTSDSIFGVSPASFESLSYTRKHYCVNEDGEAGSTVQSCEPKLLSPTSIVVTFTNASLSLWLEGPRYDWTPWNTFTELGGHALSSQQDAGNDSAAHWDGIIAKIDALSENIDRSAREAVDLIVHGESWTEDTMAAFEQRVQMSRKNGKIAFKGVIHQPDHFAASKRSARWGSYHLDTWDVCYMFTGDGPAHDEL